MTFEFVIVYQCEAGMSIHEMLLDLLRNVLAANLNEFDDDATARMLIPNFERRGKSTVSEAGVSRCRTALGFTLELPDDTLSARAVIDDFLTALADDPIEHVVKFEDDLLRQELAQRTEELFTLEMKLRRVLSLIYLHAYQEGDPYDLLCEEAVKPMASERPPPAQMKAVAENQFFHLVFSQYVGLNQRPEPRLPTLLEKAHEWMVMPFRVYNSQVPTVHARVFVDRKK